MQHAEVEVLRVWRFTLLFRKSEISITFPNKFGISHCYDLSLPVIIIEFEILPCSSRYQSLQLFVESSILKYPSLCSLMLYHNVCSDSNRNKSNIESSTFSSYVLENIETCSVW